jgi:hypothetical protein
MPLHVDVYVNNFKIEQLHIGRLEGGIEADDINTYKLVIGDEPIAFEEWEQGIEFTHRYGDGALTCVKKAIEAYERVSSSKE